MVAEFHDRYPVGQAILRGPIDLMSALLGETGFLYALYDNPDRMVQFSRMVTELHNQFLKEQMGQFPQYHGGYVIGQYHLWAPGKCARLQEDASSLLSPTLYKQFFQEGDREMARVAEFNLLHLHTSSLSFMDLFWEIEELRAIQVSLDVGGPSLKEVLPSLKKIQKSGKCLVIKGVWEEELIALAKRELNPRGLCLQAVVDNVNEAKNLRNIFAHYYEGDD